MYDSLLREKQPDFISRQDLPFDDKVGYLKRRHRHYDESLRSAIYAWERRVAREHKAFVRAKLVELLVANNRPISQAARLLRF